MRANTRKIKACPFCMGQNVDLIELSYNLFVECEDCAAQGPAICTDEDKAEDKAIAAWNKRGTVIMQKQRLTDEEKY